MVRFDCTGPGKAAFPESTESNGGCTRGAKAPLVGGAAARGVPAFFAGGARVAAWGEPARPGFSPGGGNGKGGFSNSLRRRRFPALFAGGPCDRILARFHPPAWAFLRICF